MNLDTKPVNAPGAPQLRRVIVYIDGFNFYFGLRDSGFRRYFWLDVLKLAETLLLEDQRLESVHYFTARVSGGGKERRQRSYLDALGTLPRDRVTVRYGKYQMSPRTCLHCGAQDEVPGEKMTDVNIAVEMLTHAFQDRFDTALLISGDSDLRGPVERIRTLFPAKKVVIAFPPGRFSAELKAAATAVFRIGRANLAKSQFPERIETPDLTVKRPETWS